MKVSKFKALSTLLHLLIILVELMMEKHLQTASDLEVLETGSDEWHISDWRALERKSYSDYWHLGGYKWYITPHLRDVGSLII